MDELKGSQKVKVFLSLLGDEVLANVLRYLPVEQADRLRQVMQEKEIISPHWVTQVLQEFTQFSSLPPPTMKVPQPGSPTPRPKGEGDQALALRLARCLEMERAPMIAFVLHQWFPQLAQPVIAQLTTKRLEIEASLRNMEIVPMAHQLETTLKPLVEKKLSR